MLLLGVLVTGIMVYLLQHGLYRWLAARRVTYSRLFSRSHLFAGEKLQMVETVANRNWLPLPSFRVESVLPAFLEFRHTDAHVNVNSGKAVQNHRSLFAVPPFTEITRTYEVVGASRGVHHAHSAAITVGDVVGAAAAGWQAPLDGEVVVFPRLLALGSLPSTARSWLESELGTAHSFEENHYLQAGVRPYSSRDSIRKVDWRATARTGELLVRKMESVVDQRLILCLNIDDKEGMWNAVNNVDLAERTISTAATLAVNLLSRGYEAGFAANAPAASSDAFKTIVPPGGGRPQMERILEAMARLELESRTHFYELVAAIAAEYRGIRLLLVTAVSDRRVEAAVQRLRGQRVRIDVIRVPGTGLASRAEGGGL